MLIALLPVKKGLYSSAVMDPLGRSSNARNSGPDREARPDDYAGGRAATLFMAATGQ